MGFLAPRRAAVRPVSISAHHDPKLPRGAAT